MGLEAIGLQLGGLALNGITQAFSGPDENLERQKIAQALISEYTNANGYEAKAAWVKNQVDYYGSKPYEQFTKVQKRYYDAWASVSGQIKADLAQSAPNLVASIFSTNNQLNSNSSNMNDTLKKYLFPGISVAVGVGSIVYYASAKSAQDKKKRKLFLWVGILAAAVGGFLGYKKFKG
jgi:hypothetical protein